jgi:hypothetical protein
MKMEKLSEEKLDIDTLEMYAKATRKPWEMHNPNGISLPDTALMARELLSLRKMQEPCKWEQDEDGNYHTGCGCRFWFEEDTATENKIKYCGFCGHTILDVPYTEPEVE